LQRREAVVRWPRSCRVAAGGQRVPSLLRYSASLEAAEGVGDSSGICLALKSPNHGVQFTRGVNGPLLAVPRGENLACRFGDGLRHSFIDEGEEAKEPGEEGTERSAWADSIVGRLRPCSQNARRKDTGESGFNSCACGRGKLVRRSHKAMWNIPVEVSAFRCWRVYDTGAAIPSSRSARMARPVSLVNPRSRTTDRAPRATNGRALAVVPRAGLAPAHTEPSWWPIG